MSEQGTESVAPRLDSRLQDLRAAQKALKRASVLPLVERRRLAAEVDAALARLEALREPQSAAVSSQQSAVSR